MNWDWGSVSLATAALIGVAVWVLQFCCMAHSEPLVPEIENGSVEHVKVSIGMDRRLDEVERRMAVIRSSAQVLLDNRETEDIKSLMCKFIIEETDRVIYNLRGP